jgi:hypothetical protein
MLKNSILTKNNLEKEMNTISCVSIGDGAHTCFWTDDWLGEGDLQSRFPALFSHAN